MTTPLDISHTPRLTLLLGGVRSGKSARALTLAQARQGEGRVLFVATAEAHDGEMAARIAAHRRERSPTWDTLEAPLALADSIKVRVDGAAPSAKRYTVVIVDCLTLWVSNLLLSLPEDADAEDAIGARVTDLLAVCIGSDPAIRWIVVSNEVGLGIVPPTSLGRRYRDALGRANQLVAAAADEVTLMVAGLELKVRG
jgi:adenosylcobinamide kinase/adenosylcobinamide-phosphate guanylyltransferase